MEKINKIINKREISIGLFYLSISFFFIGEFFSRALLSISPGVMLLACFINPDFFKIAKDIVSFRKAIVPASLFFLLLLSIIISDDLKSWGNLFLKNLPMFIFPFCFSFFKGIPEKHKKFIFYFFFFCLNLVVLLTLFDYYSNFSYYNNRIEESKNIQGFGGLFHIHLGILLALGIFFCYDILKNDKQLSKLEKGYIYFSFLFLFAGLHIFAFRTGLLALYLTILLEIVFLIIQQKKYLVGVFLFLGLIIIPVSAIKFIPSIQQRMNNTTADLMRYKNGQDINYYSISQRFAAWETAYSIFKRNWLIGISPADLETEMEKQYTIKDFGLIKDNWVLIHNQYIYYATCYGILGFIVFCWFIFKPFIYGIKINNYKLIYFISIIASVFMVDTVLGLQTGLNLIMFFYSYLFICWD